MSSFQTNCSDLNPKKQQGVFSDLISYVCDVKCQWNTNTIGQINLSLDSGTTKPGSIHKLVVQLSSDSRTNVSIFFDPPVLRVPGGVGRVFSSKTIILDVLTSKQSKFSEFSQVFKEFFFCITCGNGCNGLVCSHLFHNCELRACALQPDLYFDSETTIGNVSW